MLPSRLLARYRAAEKDPELTSLRDELALVDARLADLLSRVDSGESGTLWRNVTQAYAAFKRDRRLGCVDTMQESLAVFEARLDAATQDHDAWAAVMELIERRRKLAASELRRLVTLESMISAERAMILLGVVVEIIRKYVSDRTVLAQIARELQCLGQHACGDHAVIGGSSITAPRPPKRSSE